MTLAMIRPPPRMHPFSDTLPRHSSRTDFLAGIMRGRTSTASRLFPKSLGRQLQWMSGERSPRTSPGHHPIRNERHPQRSPGGSPNSWSGWTRLSRSKCAPEEEADRLAGRGKIADFELADFHRWLSPFTPRARFAADGASIDITLKIVSPCDRWPPRSPVHCPGPANDAGSLSSKHAPATSSGRTRRNRFLHERPQRATLGRSS